MRRISAVILATALVAATPLAALAQGRGPGGGPGRGMGPCGQGRTRTNAGGSRTPRSMPPAGARPTITGCVVQRAEVHDQVTCADGLLPVPSRNGSTDRLVVNEVVQSGRACESYGGAGVRGRWQRHYVNRMLRWPCRRRAPQRHRRLAWSHGQSCLDAGAVRKACRAAAASSPYS